MRSGLESVLRRIKESDATEDLFHGFHDEGEDSCRIFSLVRGFDFLATILAILVPGRAFDAPHVDRLVSLFFAQRQINNTYVD